MRLVERLCALPWLVLVRSSHGGSDRSLFRGCTESRVGISRERFLLRPWRKTPQPRSDLEVAPGIKDILIACTDALSGFADALHAAFPQAKVQLCVVHLARAALKYVVDKDSDKVIADLKEIYQAATVVEAEEALEVFAQAWGAEYPTIVKQWRLKWPDIVAVFDFPPEIRKAIYTTDAIESVNSVIRK